MYRIIVPLVSLAIICLVFIVETSRYAAAECDYQPDGNDCPSCFDDTGAWEPTGDILQDLALKTLNTRESCLCPGVADCNWDPDPSDPDNNFINSGKPYYQMVLGCYDPFQAFSVIVMMDWGEDSFHHRVAWCTEAVAFWHKHWRNPYAGGYRCDWHQNWQVYNARSLMQWYAHEGLLLPNGRGRWIYPQHLDYETAELGKDIPVPGAYVAIRGYERGNPDQWKDWSKTGHSLIIDEMWIHRDDHGNVFRITVTLLEGNSDNRVRNDRPEWADILDLTPRGPAWLGQRKIFGFGIDLNESGAPIYDPSRLHYVDHKFLMAAPSFPPVESEDTQWDELSFKAVTAYAKTVRKEGGPTVECSPDKVSYNSLPGSGTSWEIPSGLGEELVIDVDLLDGYPLPITGIELVWDAGFIPSGYKVLHAETDQEYVQDPVPDYDYSTIKHPNAPPTKHHVPIDFKTKNESVRYLRFTFPIDTVTQTAFLEEINFQYDTGGCEDAEISAYTRVTYPFFPASSLLLLD